jgi:head-tail adaptor
MERISMRQPYKTKRIDAGKYRVPCVVQCPVETVADMHSVEIGWLKYAEIRVAEMPTSGREFQQAMTTIPMLRGIYRVRSDSITRSITPRMRLVICGKVIGIDSVYDDGGERREVVIMGIEEVNV